MKNRLVIDCGVYDAVLSSMRAAIPREALVLLYGRIRGVSDFLVTHSYVPNQSYNTKMSSYFSDREKLDALRVMSKHRLEFIGIAHSHVHLEIKWDAALPSMDDAELQVRQHAPVSVIFALMGESLGVTAWLAGLTAPIRIYTRNNRRLTSVY